MPKPLRVLLVEDSEPDAELLLHSLTSSGYDLTWKRVETADDMRAELDTGDWQIILSDYSLPTFSAPDALAVLRASGKDLPLIIVSGTIGEEIAVSALKAGACDFLIKGRLARLAPAIERELREIELRHERERAHRILEEQLRQSQKMEAVGQLAGGIAHDFNNLLTAILGYCELLTDQIGPDKPVGRDLREVMAAAERAAGLTRQLLAFSRKQVLTIAALDLNQVVRNIEAMLRRLLGEHITIETSLAENLPAVMADGTQLDQVLLNLALNARDAMPQGGRLTISTQDGSPVAKGSDVRPGGYVTLTVADTGTGMTPAVQAQIFEPFFTTKERGKGTGLGLAAVHGIVSQLNGSIEVDSVVDKGSAFRVLLPATRAEVLVPPPTVAALSPIGTENILLVEDERGVRAFIKIALQRFGYHVLEADSAEAALALLETLDSPIHLLLTDVVLPKMPGRELAEHVTRAHPEVKVLYMSGYTEQMSTAEGFLEAGVQLLEKPFTVQKLLAKTRQLLG
jgi:signal transduction histidine kinase